MKNKAERADIALHHTQYKLHLDNGADSRVEDIGCRNYRGQPAEWYLRQ